VDQIIENDEIFKIFMIKINRNNALYPGSNGGANFYWSKKSIEISNSVKNMPH
jgi:hypothetical protein